METFFEKKRIAFTAALIREDFETAKTLLADVSGRLEGSPRLSEAGQKAVRQMLAAAKKIGANQGGWTKRRLGRPLSELRQFLARVSRAQVRAIEYVGYDQWRQALGLDDTSYRVMLANVSSCQLSVGCSNACRRCNEWALVGVRKHFLFDAAKQILMELHNSGNHRYALYCASDPLDYRCGGRTIDDLLMYMQRQGYTTRFGLLTKIPRGSEALACKFLEADLDIAVSLTARNKERVAAIEKSVGKRFKFHHDTDHLMIPAGLDEDFISVKPSITDNYGVEITPEAAWTVIPTFTSALNPTGQYRLPLSGKSNWFIKKKVGRGALPVEYFKPFAACRKDGTEFVLDYLLAPQIENILLDNGSQGATPPGMMDLEEYFKTFDPAVVRHRRRLAPVAIDTLRRQLMKGPDSGAKKGRDLEAVFQRKERCYLDFCDGDKVRKFKKKAVSFLLAAVAGFLETHPDEGEIIRFMNLRAPAGFQKNAGGPERPFSGRVEAVLDDPVVETFGCFRNLLSRLLDDPHDTGIRRFIDEHPAVYDPETDRYI